MDKIRLQLFMARSGAGSRRKCEEFIAEGRVRINGRRVTTQGSKVTEEDQITLDGKILHTVKKKVYLAVHKPTRYICSNSDDRNRPLTSDLFKDAVNVRLFHVGRLDFLSSGLIFYTNDGEFSRLVSHPSSGIEKVYSVESKNEIPDAVLESYLKGITIEGVKYKLKSYSRKSANSVHFTLEEGKNREIRHVFSHFHLTVKRIHRVRIGIVTIRGIPPGAYRFLSQKEIMWFKKLK
jgi:23S rRNA pseudouridine2605 synthase